MKLVDAVKIPLTDTARDSLIAMSVLWIFFTAAVGFRIYGRMRGPGIGLDDIFAIVAVVLTTGTVGLNAAVFTSGVGWNFNPDSSVYPSLVINLPYILKITFAYTLVYIWALTALKLSQIALYYRVFSLQLSRPLYIMGAIIIVWAIFFNFFSLFLCDPIAQQWTVERVGKCMDQMLLLKVLILTNLVTDLVLVVLPIRCVWQLQMRKTEKFAVLACFGMGMACVIIGIARFIFVCTIDLAGNVTGTSITTFMLCTVELMLGGICTSLPMLRPFYLKLRSKYKNSSLNGSGRMSGLKRTNMDQGGLGGSGHPRPGQYTHWMELADKDQTTATVTHDDASSERKLTAERPCTDRIQVSKDFVITRE